VHRYQDRTALNGVSFEVRPAELFGLLGPNGSGKTTLFRILSTLMVPTSGSAMIAGLDAVRQPGARCAGTSASFSRSRAWTSSSPPTKTCGIRATSMACGAPNSKRESTEILTRVGLLDRSRRSRGNFFRRHAAPHRTRQRPAPPSLKFCCFDEPTTGLDPGARHDLWQYLQILRDQERVSVIVTTHLMEEAERCDRLAILNEGNLVALGTPEALTREIGGDVILFESPRRAGLWPTAFAASFMSMPPSWTNKVRIEIENGHRFVPDVVEAFPGEIQSLSVSKPTLEDVFIHRTGHRFWNEDAAPAAETGKKKAKKKRS
jgi:ABC-2 type transport system ATP-binding protein